MPGFLGTIWTGWRGVLIGRDLLVLVDRTKDFLLLVTSLLSCRCGFYRAFSVLLSAERFAPLSCYWTSSNRRGV